MSIFSIVITVLGVLAFIEIVSGDVMSDGRYADWWYNTKQEKPVADLWYQSYKLTDPKDFACERYHHAERGGEGLWCPNPDCPGLDNEETEDTEEIEEWDLLGDEPTEDMPVRQREIRQENLREIMRGIGDKLSDDS